MKLKIHLIGDHNGIAILSLDKFLQATEYSEFIGRIYSPVSVDELGEGILQGFLVSLSASAVYGLATLIISNWGETPAAQEVQIEISVNDSVGNKKQVTITLEESPSHEELVEMIDLLAKSSESDVNGQ